jgi:hypothetical protein
MKFWVIEIDGEIAGCQLARCDAENVARELIAGQPDSGAQVFYVDAPVNATTIARLLGNEGGYATKIGDRLPVRAIKQRIGRLV